MSFMSRRVASKVLFFPVAQVVDAGAQEPHWSRCRFGLVEQSHRAFLDLIRVVRRRARVASRDGREVAVAHFDRHRPRHEAFRDQPVRVVTRHFRDLFAHPIDVHQVVRVRCTRSTKISTAGSA